MLFLLNAIFLLGLSNTFSCVDEIVAVREFKKIPDKDYYELNATVILSCEIQEIKEKIFTIFRNGKNMQSEACQVFDKKKYEMTCTDKVIDGKKFIKYELKIKKIEWSDHGKWKCIFSHYHKSVTVDIKVPASFEALRIEPIRPDDSKNNNNNLGPAFSPTDSKGNIIVRGRGSRTNPFNLRSGIALKIKCSSLCSFPRIAHSWSYANMSHGPIDIAVKNQRERNICFSSNNEGMFSIESEAIINCTALKMFGANEIVCRSAESKKSNVYVLCPGGERPWELTTGEIIGLAVSVGIILLLILLLCLMVKRSKSAYRTPPDVSTNTYSSGVKV